MPPCAPSRTRTPPAPSIRASARTTTMASRPTSQLPAGRLKNKHPCAPAPRRPSSSRTRCVRSRQPAVRRLRFAAGVPGERHPLRMSARSFRFQWPCPPPPARARGGGGSCRPPQAGPPRVWHAPAGRAGAAPGHGQSSGNSFARDQGRGAVTVELPSARTRTTPHTPRAPPRGEGAGGCDSALSRAARPTRARRVTRTGCPAEARRARSCPWTRAARRATGSRRGRRGGGRAPTR